MCLQSEFYFRALELLRWDGNYLLLAHGASDNIGFGLKRNDPNATVHEWICSPAITEKEDENDQRSYFHFESDFELCRHKGDTAGMAAAVKGYFDFWSKKKRRSEIARFSRFQNIYAPFTFFWDAFIIHFVLRRMIDDADHLDKNKMTDELDQCYFSNRLPRKTAAMKETRKKIIPPFVPVSSHIEFMIDKKVKDFDNDFYHILAYIDRENGCLLLMHPEADYHYYLLTKEPVPYSFVQQIEQKTGLLFYSRNGNGKEKVLALQKEMEIQGLFLPGNIIPQS